MRILSERLHYGTACPTMNHALEIPHNSLALFFPEDKIAHTPFLI